MACNSTTAWQPDFVAMVRESYPELQALVHTNTDRRRGTKIPLDNRNSRILRQSINNHQGHSTSIQDEIVGLERSIEQLRTYAYAVPTSLPVEDEQMHEIERYIKTIGCTACKVRSMLKHMEPRSGSTTSVECSQATIERRASYCSTRYTQYHTLALTVYAAVSSYKEIIDSYYTKLMSNSRHRPMSYWVLAEDQDDLVRTPLLDTDIASSVAKVKQRLSIQEHEVTEREKRIREWHKLLSSTFQSRLESDDDCSSSSSPLPSYDIEAGLVKVHDYKTTDNLRKGGDKQPFSTLRCALAFMLTIALVLIMLSAVAVAMFYLGFNDSTLKQLTDSPLTAINASSPADVSRPGYVAEAATNENPYQNEIIGTTISAVSADISPTTVGHMPVDTRSEQLTTAKQYQREISAHIVTSKPIHSSTIAERMKNYTEMLKEQNGTDLVTASSTGPSMNVTTQPSVVLQRQTAKTTMTPSETTTEQLSLHITAMEDSGTTTETLTVGTQHSITTHPPNTAQPPTDIPQPSQLNTTTENRIEPETRIAPQRTIPLLQHTTVALQNTTASLQRTTMYPQLTTINTKEGNTSRLKVTIPAGVLRTLSTATNSHTTESDETNKQDIQSLAPKQEQSLSKDTTTEMALVVNGTAAPPDG